MLDTCENITCPHCGNDDDSMINLVVWIPAKRFSRYQCEICSKEFTRIDDNESQTQSDSSGDGEEQNKE
jgi:transposase-like protein